MKLRWLSTFALNCQNNPWLLVTIARTPKTWNIAKKCRFYWVANTSKRISQKRVKRVTIEEKFAFQFFWDLIRKNTYTQPFPYPVSGKGCKTQCKQFFLKVFPKILFKISMHPLLWKASLIMNGNLFNTLTAERFSETGPFRHLSNHIFQNVQSLMEIPKLP